MYMYSHCEEVEAVQIRGIVTRYTLLMITANKGKGVSFACLETSSTTVS